MKPQNQSNALAIYAALATFAVIALAVCVFVVSSNAKEQQWHAEHYVAECDGRVITVSADHTQGIQFVSSHCREFDAVSQDYER